VGASVGSLVAAEGCSSERVIGAGAGGDWSGGSCLDSRVKRLEIENQVGMAGRRSLNGASDGVTAGEGIDGDGSTSPSAIVVSGSGTSVCSSCCSSSSSFTRSTLIRSQFEILKGSKTLPEDRSHQQRSATGMVDGRGVSGFERDALSASANVDMFSDHGTERFSLIGRGCQ